MDPSSIGSEGFPMASYALPPNLKKCLFFAIRGGSRNIVIYFLHASGLLFYHLTPGQHPPRDTGHCVNTETLGWVGVPITSAPRPELTQSVVLSIDVCRGLGISPIRTFDKHLAEFFSSRSLSNMCLIVFYGVYSQKVGELFGFKNRAQSKRY